MLGESGAVREGLDTNSASVRSLTIVSAHVRGDGRRLGELTVANLALKRLLARVNAEMSRQIGSLRKGFQAN